ncbi:MAG: hypothetical protein K0B06_01045 [Brevefilum sp.]|nr:hypothetical protein [Brevefilum sp.]
MQLQTWQQKEGHNQRSLESVTRALLLPNKRQEHDQLDDQEEMEDEPF